MKKGKVQRFMARQGDVLILSVDKVPDKLEEIPHKGGRIVLAEGEVTGHFHAIDAPPSVAVLFQSPGTADRILRAKQPVRLLHDEHAEVEIPAGDYIVRLQREYRWGSERKVLD